MTENFRTRERAGWYLSGAVAVATLYAGLSFCAPKDEYPASDHSPEIRRIETQDPVRNAGHVNYRTEDFSRDADNVLLARMIFGEARNCTQTERIAVAYTAVNRANDGRRWNGETVRQAILTPRQYSCFNENDPNLPVLRNPQRYDPAAFDECLDIAEGVLSGRYEDPTGGATNYFNPALVRPRWAGRMTKIGRIPTEDGPSRHEFFRE